MCRGRRAHILLHLHIKLEGTVLRGSRRIQRESVLVAETIHPACMCEGGGCGGEGGGRAIGPENAVGEWARRRKGEKGAGERASSMCV
jgi:hypothetical protein